MADFPQLHWQRIGFSSTKDVSYKHALTPTEGEFGPVFKSETKRPIPEWTFLLEFADEDKVQEVFAVHEECDGVYSLTCVEGNYYEGTIKTFSAPRENGTILKHITIVMSPVPEAP